MTPTTLLVLGKEAQLLTRGTYGTPFRDSVKRNCRASEHDYYHHSGMQVIGQIVPV